VQIVSTLEPTQYICCAWALGPLGMGIGRRQKGKGKGAAATRAFALAPRLPPRKNFDGGDKMHSGNHTRARVRLTCLAWVADRHRHAAYHNTSTDDELLRNVNIYDLE